MVCCPQTHLACLYCYSPGYFCDELPRVSVYRQRLFAAGPAHLHFVAAVALLGYQQLLAHRAAWLFPATRGRVLPPLSIPGTGVDVWHSCPSCCGLAFLKRFGPVFFPSTFRLR